MSAHVYQEDTRIVLMGRVRVADWRNELRHFELSLEVADALLLKLSAEDNELGLKGAELLELLQGQGALASYVKLSDAAAKIEKTLTALAKLAWEREVPYSIDELEPAEGDEYFDEFTAAYFVEGGSGIFNNGGSKKGEENG